MINKKLKGLLAFLLVVFCVVFFVKIYKKGRLNFPDCNVILISIDTLRADHLGCYGYPKSTTPNIDKFSEDSILFKRCLAQASSTLISHASIFTSLIPLHHRACFTKKRALSEENQTIAEILNTNGYKTISFNDGGQISPEFGMSQGFDLYDSSTGDQKPDHMTFKAIVDKCTQWIDNNASKKFFMFLHTYETHHPYTPTENNLKLFESKYEGSLEPHISIDLIFKLFRGKLEISEADKQHIRNAYAAEIRSMDESFGILVNFLKKKNLYDNTIIIFTSDHGEEFDEHGVIGMHAHTLYDELLHVPLIIKLKKSKLALKKIDTNVGCIDISPTLLDLLGLENFKYAEGESLVDLIRGKQTEREGFLIAQRDRPDEYKNPEYWTIIDKTWKLYKGKLFDLRNDPLELEDVSKSYQELKGNLLKSAMEFMKINPLDIQDKETEIDDKLKEKLKSLGYIK